MSRPTASERCPDCGKPVPADAEQCPACGVDLFEEAPRPRRGKRNLRRENTVDATDFLIPTDVSAWSMASCYLGLVGFCLPLLGLLFALPAVFCGIMALRKWKRASSYGAVTGNIRTILGLVFGTLGTLIWGGMLILMVVEGAFKK